MAHMARRNHWSLRNQRIHCVSFLRFDGLEMGLLWSCCGFGVVEGGEVVFSSPFDMSFRFISSFPVVSIISSSLSTWWMPSFGGFSDAVAISAVCSAQSS